MDCRKCGAKHITRRSAGVFSCKHCGVQPGPMQLDRAGSPMPSRFPADPIPQKEIEAMDQKPPIAIVVIFYCLAVCIAVAWALGVYL